jgi:hypothetical protein
VTKTNKPQWPYDELPLNYPKRLVFKLYYPAVRAHQDSNELHWEFSCGGTIVTRVMTNKGWVQLPVYANELGKSQICEVCPYQLSCLEGVKKPKSVQPALLPTQRHDPNGQYRPDYTPVEVVLP